MGLFDPPWLNIRKKLPQHALVTFDGVVAYAGMNLDGASENQKHLVRTFVGSVWACNAASAGSFQLSQFDFRYVMNAGLNATKVMEPIWLSRAEQSVKELTEKGMIVGI